MEYIKVPYVRLRGKKYGGDLSYSDQETLQYTTINFQDVSASEIYGGTFQELAKTYQSGKDPVEEIYGMGGVITNPEKLLAIHKAILAVANKFGYENGMRKEEELIGGINLKLYQILTQSPNSYFVTTFTDKENALTTIDKDLNITSIYLPVDVDVSYFVTADKSGNILIPKEAYDQNLEVI
jgi:hypothetical protein